MSLPAAVNMSASDAGNCSGPVPGPAFPDPGLASQRVAKAVQALNLLALGLNASLVALLTRRSRPQTGARGVPLLAAAEIGINLSLFVMHCEAWAAAGPAVRVLDKFNYSFEACHLLRNFWLCTMTLARAHAVTRPLQSRDSMSARRQGCLFAAAAAVSAAWSCLDLALVNWVATEGAKRAGRALALLRHFVNTAVAGSVIAAASTLIVLRLRRTNVFNFRRRERQASRIVVSIAVAFILLELPYAFVVYFGIIWIIAHGSAGFPAEFAEVLHILYRVNHLLIVADTCLNLFVLLCLSASFRNELGRSLGCRRRAAQRMPPRSQRRQRLLATTRM